MDLLVDTSVIIAVIAEEPERDTLIGRTRHADLLAHASLHWEIGNALSAMFKRKRITLNQAREAIEAYRKIPIRFVDVNLNQALELAHRLGIYAYDAYVLASAMNHRAPLLTLDRGLQRAAKEARVEVLEVDP